MKCREHRRQDSDRSWDLMRLIALPLPALLSFFALLPASSFDNCLCARHHEPPSVVASLSFPSGSSPLCPGCWPCCWVLRPLLLLSIKLLHPCPPRPAPPAPLSAPQNQQQRKERKRCGRWQRDQPHQVSQPIRVVRVKLTPRDVNNFNLNPLY